MSAPLRITLSNNLTMPFYQTGYTGAQVLGQVPYYNPLSAYGTQVQQWQYPNPYYMKFLRTDVICVQVHTQSNLIGSIPYPPRLYICDKFKNKITAVTTALGAAPYWKGTQQILGNKYFDPYTGNLWQLDTTTWAFALHDFISDIPYGGNFYLAIENQLRDSAGSVTSLMNYSEPLFFSDYLPNTLQFTATSKSNQQKKGIVNTGWFNDFGAGNLLPYYPTYTTRAEGYIDPYKPKSINVNFEGQNYQTIPIKSQTVSTFTLNVGEICLGIPYYMFKLLTECVTSDTLFIDNILYTLHTKSIQELAELWKMKYKAGNPLIMASCELQFTNEGQFANTSPMGGVPTRDHSGGFSPS